MLKGISLTDLAAKIEANREAKRDFIVDTSKALVAASTDGAITMLEPSTGEVFPVQKHPLRQIAAHTEIPAKYFERMLADAPDLAATNVNEWFRKYPAKRMVRTMHRAERAFLSDRYQRIENDRIAEVALPVLADFPDIRIASCEVTDSRLYIQAVVPSLQGEVVGKGGRAVGDLMQAGVVISNSEVGLGRVDIAELDFRLRCLNGMVGESLFKRTHVGRQATEEGEAENIWADDTRRADDGVLMLKVRDMVRAALDGARFRARVERMNGLASAEVSGDPTKAIGELGAILPLTEGDRGGILKSLIAGGDLSAWGLLNAVTHQAHATASYDRAVEFEQMGGRLLNLPAGEWKRVLEAA